MYTHSNNSLKPTALATSIWRNRQIIFQLTRREVTGRYKGSIIGLGWSFFNPALMLSVYTFVFSVVFKARWNLIEGESKFNFAILMFVGIIMHSLLAEALNRSSSLIVSNANYVKKVIFPLEILAIVVIGAALFHLLISLSVLLIAFFLINGFIYWTAIFIPIVIIPLLLLVLGLVWFISSVGVFIRDAGQAVSALTMILLFLAPVFYPVTSLPQEYQVALLLNPLTFIIEQSRQVLIYGELPDWIGLFKYLLASSAIAWGGFVWFQITRKGFADVV